MLKKRLQKLLSPVLAVLLCVTAMAPLFTTAVSAAGPVIEQGYEDVENTLVSTVSGNTQFGASSYSIYDSSVSEGGFVRNGTHSLKFTAANKPGVNFVYTSKEALEVGKEYRVSAHVYIDSATKIDATKGVWLAVYAKFYGANNNYWNHKDQVLLYVDGVNKSGNDAIMATDRWVEVASNVTVKEGQQYIGFNLGFAGSMTYADAYIDDVTVTEIKDVTVSFNSNGGSAVAAMTGKVGEALTLPTPTSDKANLTFAGWYTDAALTTPFTGAVYPTDDITLYAKWVNAWIQDFEDANATDYSIANAAFSSTDEGGQAYSGSRALHFTSGNGRVVLASKTDSKTRMYMTANKTYLVKFQVYTAAVNGNGGLSVAEAPVASNAWSNTGAKQVYYFNSSRDNTDILNKWVEMSVEFTPTQNCWLGINTYGTFDAYIDDVEITEVKNVTVSFETNNGTTVAAMTGKTGEAFTLPTPEATENQLYTMFAGWYTDEALTVPFTAAVYPNEDITLYAKWTKEAFVQDFESFNWSGNNITAHDTNGNRSLAVEETTNATSGNKALHYNCVGAATGSVARVMLNPATSDPKLNAIVKPGDVLQVTWKYKVVSGTVNASVYGGTSQTNVWNMMSQSSSADNRGIVYNSQALTETNDQWETFSKTFLIQDVENVNSLLGVGIHLSGIGELYIDDVEISKVPTAVTTAYNGKAAIRAGSENVKQGFRLYNQINKQWIEEYNIVEYGAVAIRTARLAEGAKLTLTTEGAAKGVAYEKNGVGPKIWEETDDSIVFTAVLVGLKEKFYSQDYTVVAYAKDSFGNVLYGAEQKICVYDVVDSILSTEGAPETDVSTANAVIEQAKAANAADASVVTYDAWKAAKQ